MKRINKEMNMKKIMALFFICLLFYSSSALAQEAQIVSIKGNALVRKNESSKWEKAKDNMLLGKDAQIRTKGNSSCTLTFDEKKKSIVTVEKASTLKIESVQPGSVFLSQGRVFALIKDIKETKKFEVKTPTAVAGARGTGWATEFDGTKTSVACFDDKVVVTSLDREGRPTRELDLGKGFEIDVRRDGSHSEVRQLSEEKQEKWKEFVATVDKVVGKNLLERQAPRTQTQSNHSTAPVPSSTVGAAPTAATPTAGPTVNLDNNTQTAPVGVNSSKKAGTITPPTNPASSTRNPQENSETENQVSAEKERAKKMKEEMDRLQVEMQGQSKEKIKEVQPVEGQHKEEMEKMQIIQGSHTEDMQHMQQTESVTDKGSTIEQKGKTGEDGRVETTGAQGPKESAKETVDKLQKESVKEAVDNPPKESVKETVDKSPKESVKEAVDNPPKESVKETVDKSPKESVKETVDKPQKESVRETVDKPQKESVRETVDKPQKESAKETVDKPQKESVKETVDKSPKESVKETIDKPQKESVKEAVDKPQKENVKETIDKPQKENVKETIDKPQKENVKEAVDKPQKERAELISDKIQQMDDKRQQIQENKSEQIQKILK